MIEIVRKGADIRGRGLVIVLIVRGQVHIIVQQFVSGNSVRDNGINYSRVLNIVVQRHRVRHRGDVSKIIDLCHLVGLGRTQEALNLLTRRKKED